MTRTPDSLDALQDAIRSSPTVTLAGAGTKVRSGHEVTRIDLRALAGILDYSPDECVITVGAGTALRDIDAALRAHGQYLPFDPPLVAAGATIGGTVATGLSGPGRLRYGGVRDFLIGATVVDGDGRALKSGGKVVKNAAGFLLHHALVGSLGRLGALVQLTFKVFPAPEASATLQYRHRTFTDALTTLTRATASRLEIDALDVDGAGTLWLRLAGRRPALAARIDNARRVLGHNPSATVVEIDVLDGDVEAQFWSNAREFTWCPADAALVKIPSAPSILSEIAALRRDPTRIRFSSGGAVAWIAWENAIHILSDALRRLERPAMVVRGPSAGQRIGPMVTNEFESRVQRTLDPSQRFRAASTPAR
jgi:glycolate oxidase FAD binding subunit